VIDYGRCDPADWLPDDFGFGPAPVSAGTIRVAGDAGQPTLHLAERPAAVFDRTWDGLTLAPGAENDPGALGKQVRAGRTIRTPTFTVTTGKVHYLVRGSGLAYAAVNAHTMIQGPLHGALVTTIKAGDDFRWATHNLSAYKGHRAHVEFSAAEGADFAVALVVQGEHVPGIPGQSQPELLRVLSADALTLDSLAAGYQQFFSDLATSARARSVSEGLTKPRAHASGSDRVEPARLANWLLRHPELHGDAAEKLTAAARSWLAEEQQIAARIRRTSRLAMALRDG